MVKAFVAVDIEGVAGVVHGEEGSQGNSEYERARRLMTAEANAVVAGIFDTDPSAQVTVADVHGSHRNLIPEEMDERATLLRGKPRHFGMMEGIDGGNDLAMFVGVHGKAGTGTSALSHTFTSNILDVTVNGTSMGELGLNATMAGAFGVPVVLVAGDQTVEQETRALLGDAPRVVRVKESRAHLAAESVHPRAACRMLRAAAAEATERRAAVRPFAMDHPIAVSIAFARPVYADLAAMLDHVERVDGKTIGFRRETFPDVYRLLRVMTVLCSAPV